LEKGSWKCFPLVIIGAIKSCPPNSIVAHSGSEDFVFDLVDVPAVKDVTAVKSSCHLDEPSKFDLTLLLPSKKLLLSNWYSKV
jgi:hypothetical protein